MLVLTLISDEFPTVPLKKKKKRQNTKNGNVPYSKTKSTRPVLSYEVRTLHGIIMEIDNSVWYVRWVNTGRALLNNMYGKRIPRLSCFANNKLTEHSHTIVSHISLVEVLLLAMKITEGNTAPRTTVTQSELNSLGRKKTMISVGKSIERYRAYFLCSPRLEWLAWRRMLLVVDTQETLGTTKRTFDPATPETDMVCKECFFFFTVFVAQSD